MHDLGAYLNPDAGQIPEKTIPVDGVVGTVIPVPFRKNISSSWPFFMNMWCPASISEHRE